MLRQRKKSTISTTISTSQYPSLQPTIISTMLIIYRDGDLVDFFGGIPSKSLRRGHSLRLTPSSSRSRLEDAVFKLAIPPRRCSLQPRDPFENAAAIHLLDPTITLSMINIYRGGDLLDFFAGGSIVVPCVCVHARRLTPSVSRSHFVVERHVRSLLDGCPIATAQLRPWRTHVWNVCGETE